MNTRKMLQYYAKAAKSTDNNRRLQFLFLGSYYEWKQAREILSQANRNIGCVTRSNAMRWLNLSSKNMRERYNALRGV